MPKTVGLSSLQNTSIIDVSTSHAVTRLYSLEILTWPLEYVLLLNVFNIKCNERSRILQLQVKPPLPPLLYWCITSVRISAMFENARDPRTARWNRMHERTFQFKMCYTSQKHTLGMVWNELTNTYRGSVFMARPLIHHR